MLTRIINRLRRTGRDLLLTSQIPSLRDQARVRRRLSGIARTGRHHVLVAPPGGGNIGDQALVEAFLETTSGPVRVVTRRESDVAVPAWAAERVRVEPLPDLLYGAGRAHRADLLAFAALLADASDLSVTGADIMDGRYSLRASVNRASIAAAAARSGIPTRVLGFSWNGQARRAARDALIRAARAGVALLLRDPISAERARADGVRPVTEVADIVFAARTVVAPDPDPVAGISGPVALVNVSALVGAALDQTAEYVHVVEHLRSRGCHVVLLPHVSRPKGDDIAASAAVAERVGEEAVTFVRRLLTPAEIRSLTARADITVTGRMHLAIMSLWNGTPAVTLATQGKVEGLMEMLGTPEFCVTPEPGFGTAVTAVLDAARPPDSSARARIAAALPLVKEKALRNTAHLAAALHPVSTEA